MNSDCCKKILDIYILNTAHVMFVSIRNITHLFLSLRDILYQN